jgi:5-enolpyruvylshikimate-3-phosphate synthase
MADLDRIKRDIKQIAQRQRGTRFREIKRVVDQLSEIGFTVSSRSANETHLFRVNDQLWGVCTHNRGSQHVKSVYVRAFLLAMANLDLYDEGEQ